MVGSGEESTGWGGPRDGGRAGAGDARAGPRQGDFKVIPPLLPTEQRVVQKARDFVLRDDKGAVVWSGKWIYIYCITQVEGPRFRLRAEPEDGGPSGWVAAGDVVRIEQAVDFFTGRIRANPKDAFAYLMRATPPI